MVGVSTQEQIRPQVPRPFGSETQSFVAAEEASVEQGIGNSMRNGASVIGKLRYTCDSSSSGI